MCLAQRYNVVTLVRLKPTTPLSRGKQSTVHFVSYNDRLDGADYGIIQRYHDKVDGADYGTVQWLSR